MFTYYSNAELCIVYLFDVPTIAVDRHSPTYSGSRSSVQNNDNRMRAFYQSSWWVRGWTLQELLAPQQLFFYDQGFNIIGSKLELCFQVSEITGIKVPYLIGQKPINRASIATRMSWASNRTTTRLEDEAYSLLGIFDVNMPLVYGEGKMAFFRLQREILANSDDESIFGWLPDGVQDDDEAFGMLAESTRDFRHSQRITRIKMSPERRMPYALTNKGLEFQLGYSQKYEAEYQTRILGPDQAIIPLACLRTTERHGKRKERTVAIFLSRIDGAWYRINCSRFLYTQEKRRDALHFRTFYVAQPNLTTTHRMSKEEILDYTASLKQDIVIKQEQQRLRREDRKKYLLPTVGLVLGLSAASGLFTRRSKHRDNSSDTNSEP